jgi:hypothetical protein
MGLGATYKEQVAAVWDAVYGTDNPAVAQPGLAIDRSRRRAAVLERCTAALPATTRIFCGTAGGEGLDAYLTSAYWRERPARPGSLFPDAASTVASFAEFLRANWLAATEAWIESIVTYEFGVLWGEPSPPPAAGPALPPGTWVAECPYDVPEYTGAVTEACRLFPWRDAVLMTKVRRRPFATVSIPALGSRVRRIHLRDESVDALRGLWDPAAKPAASGQVLEAAMAWGIVVDAPASVTGART